MRKLRLRKIKGLSPSHTASRQRSQGSQPLCHVAFHPTCQPFTAASSSDCSMLPGSLCLLLLGTSHHVLSSIWLSPSLIRLAAPWGQGHVLFIPVPRCSPQYLAQNLCSKWFLLTVLYWIFLWLLLTYVAKVPYTLYPNSSELWH